MASVSTSTGLVSGINYGALIDGLMALEEQPKTQLQTRIDTANAKILAYTDLKARVATLQLTATTLSKASTFQGTSATSSNADVLSATTGTNAAVGSYQFRVAQMVTAQQTVSKGFGSSTSSTLGRVRQTVAISDTGDSSLTPHVPLSWLNGGQGVSSGTFQITSHAGTKATVNTAGATSLEQVVGLINSTNIGVTATYTADGIQLTDNSTGTNSLTIQDLYNGSAASTLGIAQSTTSNTLTSSDLRYLSTTTQLSSLNGGQGVRTAGGSSPDFTITTADGVDHTVTLGSGAQSIQQVITAINQAAPGSLVASYGSGKSSNLVLTDITGGGGTLKITQASGSHAAEDLGLLTPASGNVITGTDIQAAYNTAQVVGTITMEMGGGELNSDTQLASLNGGAGVHRGIFRITDRSGAATNIDISGAVTLEDVVNQINAATDISVHASIKDNGLVLQDLTGETASDLKVRDLGSGTAAADLGLAGNSNTATLTGKSINYLGTGTGLNVLNDGRGVRTAGSGKADFRIALGSDQFDVSLDGATTLGDVISMINNAAPGRLQASVGSDGQSLQVKDLSNSGSLSITALNSSKAAADLGIAQSVSGNTITGGRVLSDLGTVLLSSLNGGSGLTLGKVTIKDRAGNSDTLDLSSCQTVQDVIDKLNSSSTIKVQASLKASANGIQLMDTSGSTGDLTITNADTTNSATALGLVGTFDSSYSSVQGANLQRQWLTENTPLSQMNGGKGITAGSFQITSAKGVTATVDLTSASTMKLGDVIKAINNAGMGVTASINKTGDGLLLTDTSGGTGKLVVAESGSTTAGDLGIKGTATVKSGDTQQTLDGSYERSFVVTAGDTLQTLQTRINSAGFGASAAILNDGSGSAGYRLSLTARNSGTAGRVVLDAGTTDLGLTNLVQAQDAAVFVGGSAASSLLVTSSTNTINNVIQGVTLTVSGTSDSPVTVNVSRNIDTLVKSLGDFTDNYNQLMQKIQDLTKFDAADPTQNGLLLADPTVMSLQDQLNNAMTTVITGAGKYKSVGALGFTFQEGTSDTTDGTGNSTVTTTLQFDEDTFRTAFAADPTSVTKFFSLSSLTNGVLTQNGWGAALSKIMKNMSDPADGLLTEANNTLTSQVSDWTSRMSQLDDQITAKRTRLQNQMASLEGTLAQLQSQQSTLSQWSAQAKSA